MPASQQTNYTNGLVVTHTMLNSEFGEIYTWLNTQEYVKNLIATNIAKNLEFDNTYGISFENAAGTVDSRIYEDASDNLIAHIGTGGKKFYVTDSNDANVFKVDVDSSIAASLKGYRLRALDSTNTDYIDIHHNGTNGYVNTSAGDMYFQSPANGNVQVFEKMPRRGHTGNNYVDSFIQRGWTYIQGDNTTAIASAVTFTKAFSTVTVTVVASLIGQKSGVPANESDVPSGVPFATSVCARQVSTTGFTLNITSTSTNFSSSDYFACSWIAIGAI